MKITFLEGTQPALQTDETAAKRAARRPILNISYKRLLTKSCGWSRGQSHPCGSTK